MMNSKSLDKQLMIFEKNFFDMEKKLDLFNLKIKDVYFWMLLRADMFFNHKFKLLDLQKSAPSKVSTVKNDINKYFNSESSAFAHEYTSEYIFFDRGKKVESEHGLEDIFISDIVKEVEKKNKSYLYIDMPYFEEYIEPVGKNIEGLKYFPNPTELSFNNDELEIIKKLEKSLESITGGKYNLTNNIKNRISRFKKEYLYFKKLFIKRKPVKVFTTISYRRYSMIAAAKDLSIETVDIQYANISKSHPGYSFPNCRLVPYFPDKVVLWGEFWREITPLPLVPENCIIAAPKHYNFIQRKFENSTKEKITLLSQPAFSQTFYDAACKLAKELNDREIVLRLHPGETDLVFDNIPVNLSISTYLTEDLHELLSKTEIQIGVSSTAVYEGLLFGVKSIILDLPTSTEMEHLVNNKICIYSTLDNLNKTTIDLLGKEVSYSIKHIYNFGQLPNDLVF